MQPCVLQLGSHGDTQQGHAQAAFLGQCVTADSCQPVWDTAVTVVCTTPRVSSHPGPHGATACGRELSDEEVTSCHCVSKGKREWISRHSLSSLQSHCPQAAPASWHQWQWPSSLVSDNGNVVPRGLVALCGTRTVSLAGWWLVAASRAQQREYGDRGRMGTEGGERGQWKSRAGPGGCAGTRLTAVPCPSAPTLPVTAPQI